MGHLLPLFVRLVCFLHSLHKDDGKRGKVAKFVALSVFGGSRPDAGFFHCLYNPPWSRIITPVAPLTSLLGEAHNFGIHSGPSSGVPAVPKATQLTLSFGLAG